MLGALMCAKAAIPRMSAKHGGQGGAIVLISSMAATLGSAGEYVWYAASKGAVDSMTIGLVAASLPATASASTRSRPVSSRPTSTRPGGSSGSRR